MQFSQFRKKMLDKVGFVCLNNLTIGIIVFQSHLWDIFNLVFLSILDQHLLNNFLKNKNKVYFLWIFFPKLSAQFFNRKNFKFKDCSPVD